MKEADVRLLGNRNADLVHEKEAIPYVDSIFQQPWWLEAVASGRWGTAQVKVGDTVRARMPYVMKPAPLGVKIITMPLLTPYLGPWLAPIKSKYVHQLAQQKELLNALIDQLPAHDYFIQNCHYSLKNWLPFYWRNFNATVKYHYFFEELNNLDEVWKGMRDKTRAGIRKAERQLTVRQGEDIDEFLEINARSFARQGTVLTKSYYDVARRVDAVCASRKARRIFFAEDAKGRIHAANYVVFDEKCVYGLMSGETPELRDSSGASLLLWEIIKFAAVSGRNFDMCGSVIERFERFLRGFGGELRPYFSISKLNRRGRLMMAANNLIYRLQRGKRQ